MRRTKAYLLIGVSAGLAVALAGCSRYQEEPGASRLSIPRLTDPTPYDRPHTDNGRYIDKMPR